MNTDSNSVRSGYWILSGQLELAWATEIDKTFSVFNLRNSFKKFFRLQSIFNARNVCLINCHSVASGDMESKFTFFIHKRDAMLAEIAQTPMLRTLRIMKKNLYFFQKYQIKKI